MMFRKTLLLALLPIILWGLLGLSSNVVQIGTFNLNFFTDLNPSTGKWCEKHNPRTLQEIKALAQFIDSLDIEVLALQEVENAAAIDLLLQFVPPEKYAYVMLPQTHPETCQRIAVLYQKEEVEIRFAGTVPLSLNRYGLRDGLVVQGKFLPDGFDFTMVVVHLKAFFDSKSREIRKRQLSLLGQWVKSYLSNSENDPDLILIGDFNEHLLTNAEAFSLIDEGEGLYDVLRDAPDTTCTPLSHYWVDPIDHILISKDARNEYAGTAEVDNFFTDSFLPYRYTYSDHCVIWADFKNEDIDSSQPSSPQADSTQKDDTCRGTYVLKLIENQMPEYHRSDYWMLIVYPEGSEKGAVAAANSTWVNLVVFQKELEPGDTIKLWMAAIDPEKYPDVGQATYTITIPTPCPEVGWSTIFKVPFKVQGDSGGDASMTFKLERIQ